MKCKVSVKERIIMRTYPRILQHAGSQDQVVDGAEHHHDADQDEDDIPHLI